MKLLRAIILGAGLLFVSSSVFAGGACCAAKKDKTAGEGTAPVVASADAGALVQLNVKSGGWQ